MTAWRMIQDPPADGAWNLAVDEAILTSHARGVAHHPVTLRLYGWSPAALSLGRGQPAWGGTRELARLCAQGIDLVRRPTGGRAVLHEHERTYAVSGPLRSAPFPGGVLATYARLAAALVAALGRLGIRAESAAAEPGARRPDPGPAACFLATSAHEITAAGRKLVGSAQLRRGGAFLQHGSIPLRVDPRRLARALGAEVDPRRFTDLATLLGRDPEPPEIDRALVGALEEGFGVRLLPGKLTAEERECATRLYSWKYSSLAWTLGGRPGERERRWGGPLEGA